MSFEQARDISEVFLPLAGRAGRVENRPDFALKNILKAGDGQLNPEDLTHGRTSQEYLVTGIGLNLDAQIRPGRGHINAVRKPFNLELLP